MCRPTLRHFPSRLAPVVAAVAVLVSAGLAPAVAARCRLACGNAAELVDAKSACCAEHERQAPVRHPAPEHDDHDAACCAFACQVCAARPMCVAAGSAPLIDLPPLSATPVEPAGPADVRGVALSIFHPPRA